MIRIDMMSIKRCSGSGGKVGDALPSGKQIAETQQAEGGPEDVLTLDSSNAELDVDGRRRLDIYHDVGKQMMSLKFTLKFNFT